MRGDNLGGNYSVTVDATKWKETNPVTLDAESDKIDFPDYGSNVSTLNPPVNVVLKRKFNANAWNSLVLPFDLSAEQISTVFGSDAKLAILQNSEPDLETYNFTMTFRHADALTADEPLLIYGVKQADSYTFENVNIAGHYTDSPFYTDGSYTDMTGTYKKTTLPKGNWYISSDNTFYRSTGTETIMPTRATFRCSTAEFQAKSITMVIDGETTSINSIDAPATTSDGKLFNLAGQRVDKSYKGIVIVNGKKYINK